MKKQILPCALAAALALSLAAPAALAADPKVTISEQYLFAGRNGDWYTEEAYQASPVVSDLDGDGKLEVLNAAHSLVVMDAATGQEKWRVGSGQDRSGAGSNARQVFTDFEVTDIDADGRKEIVIAYGNGTISVLDDQGYFKSGWPQKPVDGGIRALAVGDLDGDGKKEIVVGAGVASPKSVWVYRADGTVAPGWPQLSDDQYGSGWGYGVFADGIALGDLDSDGKPEIVVATDTAFLEAYHADGTLVPASDIYGGVAWGKVALYEDYDEEIAGENGGWGKTKLTGKETRAQLYRSELGSAAPIYTDVDGDGTSEIVITSLMTDRTSHSTNGSIQLEDTRYMTVFILNQDRSRYVNEERGFDWSTPPVDLGRSLKHHDSTSVFAGVAPEPVAADLDGDGFQEILFNSYNGKLHCFSLDGQEHGSWPFTMPKSKGSVYEYATPPACVDLDGDGTKEVIFASWIDSEDGKRTGVNGALYVLSHDGTVLARQDLHDGYASYEGDLAFDNGSKAAPLVADIDADGKYEVLLNTTYYALCVYELTTEAAPAPEPAPAPAAMAYARDLIITIDGKPVTFQAYALKEGSGETNYVKAREVALRLNGTESQFNVTWDGAVNLLSHTPYEATGGELENPFSGDRAYTVSTAVTKVDGTAVDIQAIVLTDDAGGGYTYYKLKDLADALGFTADWNARDGVTIRTQ